MTRQNNNSIIFNSLFQALPFGVYIVDVQSHQLLFANRHLSEMVGGNVREGGICYREIFNFESPCMHCRIKELRSDGEEQSGDHLTFEFFNEYNDRWYQFHELMVPWTDGRLVKCTFAVDISELKAAQNSLAEAHARLAIKNEELETLYARDVLTGAYNRVKLDEIMDKELGRYERYGRLFSIILMDIDDFKDINDTLGHLAGDRVLYEMSNLLAANTRATDLLCRWGGEEFLLVCPETDSSGVRPLAENLRQMVAGHEFECGRRITISLGAATVRPEDTQDSMIARADKAMYLSKSQGKNACNFM